MLGCERKPVTATQDVVGRIRSHWDQSFVSEDLQLVDLLADETLTQFSSHQLQLNYQNVGSAVRQIKPPIDNTRCSNDHQMTNTHYYVNSTTSLGGLSVPQNVAVNMQSLRLDLSPMSPRSQPTHAASDRSSTVVQVALSRLHQSGFYHGPISPSRAQELLHTQPPGTFLVRDSSDRRFLFSLTVRIPGMSPHLM